MATLTSDPRLDRDARLDGSMAKIRAPFALDPELRFYSPQDNRDAFAIPRVKAWLEFITTSWTPTPVEGATSRVALFVPCTKYKPYATSREHRAINTALLDAGWAPVGRSDAPEELKAVLDADEDAALLHEGPLRRGDVVLDRFVISEPMALVPYDHIYWWNGEASLATAYDDPGLFESRGTSVSPERADCTATQRKDGGWAWGPGERDAYVDAHEVLVNAIGDTLERIATHYSGMVAWVSPGLTHRSFFADQALRKLEGLPASKQGMSGRRALTGVLDRLPGLVDVLPTRAQIDDAKVQLAKRLAREGRSATDGAVRSVFARGDGNDTPLGLPELLAHLVGQLDTVAGGTR